MKQKSYLFVITLFLSLIFSTNIYSQNFDKTDWKLKTTDNNLKLYTRSNEQSGVKEVRIKTEINTTIEKLLSVLDDVSNYEKWVYKCSEAKMVKMVSKDDYYYYTRSDLPFPLSDRDIVVRSRQWKDKDDVYYSHSTLTRNMVGIKKGIVRIQEFDAHWKITQKENGILDIDYVVQTHPGGSLPTWAINLGIAKGPIETMKNLIKQLKLK